MPRHTAQPCYRITRKEDHYEVRAFPVVNRIQVPGGWVQIPLGDKQAFTEMVEDLIVKTRERFGK